MSPTPSSPDPADLARLIVERANDVIYSFDPQGILTSANPAIERVLGYTPAEVIGTRKVFEAIHPDDLPVALEHNRAKMEGREERSVYELRMVRKDGGTVWCEVSSHAIRRDGRTVAIQGVLRDVTDRKRHEAALEASEARWKDLWENSTDVLYTHDLTGRFTSANATALRTYGYTLEEFLARNIKDLVDPGHLETAQKNMRAKASGSLERTLPYEILTRGKDGSPVWIEVHTRIITKDGKPFAVAGTGRIISKRKAEEARVNLVQEMALELAQAGDFTAALQATLDKVCQATGWVYGEAWVPDQEGYMTCSPAFHAGKPGLEKFRHLSKGQRFEPTEGLAGQLWAKRRPIWIEDVRNEPMRRSAAAEAAGLRTLVGVLVLDGDRRVADLVFMNTAWRAGDERWVAALEAIATQMGVVLGRRRAEDQLRRQARLFTAQMAVNPVAALASDPSGNLLWANNSFLDMAGVKMLDGARFGVERKPFSGLVDKPARLAEFASQVCQTQERLVPVGARVYRRDDRPLRDAEGPLGHIWYFIDMTEESPGRGRA